MNLLLINFGAFILCAVLSIFLAIGEPKLKTAGIEVLISLLVFITLFFFSIFIAGELIYFGTK